MKKQKTKKAAAKPRTFSPISIGEAKGRFLKENAKKYRARTIADYEKFFAHTDAFNSRKMGSIADADAKAMVSRGKHGERLSGESRLRAARLFRTFFNWGRRNGYCLKNPFQKMANAAKDKKKKLVKIYAPEAAKALVGAFGGGDCHAAAILMAYAGIRPEEIASEFEKDTLKWSDIDFKGKKIHIRGGVSKTGEERIIYDIPEIIWKKLKPFSKNSDKKSVADSFEAFKNARNKAVEASGIKWIQDGFRHSFASYVHHIVGVEHAVKVLGHDYKTFKEYYLRVVTPEAAHEYFEIKGATLGPSA